MRVLNLLNAINLEPKHYIIIGIAAALLVAAIAVVGIVVARKKRKNSNASTTNEHDDEANTVEKPVVEEKHEQADLNAMQESAAEPTIEAMPDDANAEEERHEDELAELPIAGDENADEIEEEVTVQLDENCSGGDIVMRRIQYNRSFLARLTQASDEVKAVYSELKNELLSYAKVKPALSWRRERFSIGRNTFACFALRGKKLSLCFAADPKRFDDTKYKVIDLSIRSPKNKLPCKYRITSERRVTYAKEIIAMLLAELSVEKFDDYTQQDYTMPYRDTDALIEDKLIKVKIIEGVDNTATTLNDVEQIKKIVKQTEQLPKRDFKILPKVEATEVNVMSDIQAAKIIEYKVVKRKKTKGAKGIINIDVLSKKFPAGALITIDVLHELHVIPNNVNYIKVLAKGILDKPLIIEADDFSLQAVKMIALTGGRVIRTSEK